jgi:hypothetical protein
MILDGFCLSIHREFFNIFSKVIILLLNYIEIKVTEIYKSVASSCAAAVLEVRVPPDPGFFWL